MTIDSANFLTIDIGGLYWHRFFPHEFIGDDGKTYAYKPEEINEAMANFQTWITDRYGDQHTDGPVKTESSTRPPFKQRSAPAQGRTAQGGGATLPILDGWECDNCGGPVARKVKTGKMSGDAAICAGNCKDGRYPHHVDWLTD